MKSLARGIVMTEPKLKPVKEEHITDMLRYKVGDLVCTIKITGHHTCHYDDIKAKSVITGGPGDERRRNG